MEYADSRHDDVYDCCNHDDDDNDDVVDDDDADDDDADDDDNNQIKIVYCLSPWLLEEIRYTVEHRR